MKKRLIAGIVVGLFATQGCAGTARLEDLPTSANQIDFPAISTSGHNEDRSGRTTDTKFQYFVSVEPIVPHADLANEVSKTLRDNGFKIRTSDAASGVIIGSRGLRMWEWSTAVGVYFRDHHSATEVYFDVRITQDVTGGPNRNRAKELAEYLCERLETCVSPEGANSSAEQTRKEI